MVILTVGASQSPRRAAGTTHGWERGPVHTKGPKASAGAAGPRSAFASFLKTSRRSISPDAVALGSWKRLPVRRGRPVTQEEIAEAVGISRNWYRRLENGDAPRASAKLLDRLAKAFQFGPEERTNLFVLGIPELAQVRAI